MKQSSLFPYSLLFLLATVIFLFIKLHGINGELKDLKKTTAQRPVAEAPMGKVNLIGIMKDNLYFANKLYFAGSKGNWELAEFYHHELEEGMEQVIQRQLYYDGFDVTGLSKEMFLPPFEQLGKTLAKKDSAVFRKDYEMLVRSCNSCHVASDHGFIKVTVPERPTVSNQEF